MSETIDDRKIFTLLDVTSSIRKTLAKRYTSSFWVKAEMNKLNHYSHSGHCYPDLVEKKNGKVIAQIRANLWKFDFFRINNNFLKVLKEPLKDGIKILFRAKVSFDPVYGLSLNILDIDPSFTLGDLEMEKQETIQKLQSERLFDKNKKLPFPLLPQNLAIISVETSKGYADFLRVMENNQWGYRFFHMLFPSILQGEKAVDGIIRQLGRIHKVKHHFDVVAIIRGGGGDVGLSCYNHYELAKTIAEFPLPVITGIGHATNETVAEMVGYENGITPTKVAELLIQYFHNFSEPVNRARESISEKSLQRVFDEKSKLQSESKLFRSVTKNILATGKQYVVSTGRSLGQSAAYLFRNERKELDHLAMQSGHQTHLKLQEHQETLRTIRQKIPAKIKAGLAVEMKEIGSLERTVKALHPENVLRRGYSITMKNGKALTSVDQIVKDEEIETILFDGKIGSIVKSKNTNS